MIKIFTNSKFPNCKACVMAKKYFYELKLEYEEIDISTNMKEYYMLSKQKRLVVPLIQIGTDSMIGFSKKRINEMLINNKENQ